MSKEKQIEEKAIEEMAKVIEITEQIARDAHCGLPSPRMYAKDLYWHGFRKQSGWISVEERLPDAQGHFLIVDKEGQMNTAFYSLRFGWFSDFRKKNITHWMPLPEAPKGGA